MTEIDECKIISVSEYMEQLTLTYCFEKPI